MRWYVEIEPHAKDGGEVEVGGATWRFRFLESVDGGTSGAPKEVADALVDGRLALRLDPDTTPLGFKAQDAEVAYVKQRGKESVIVLREGGAGGLRVPLLNPDTAIDAVEVGRLALPDRLCHTLFPDNVRHKSSWRTGQKERREVPLFAARLRPLATATSATPSRRAKILAEPKVGRGSDTLPSRVASLYKAAVDAIIPLGFRAVDVPNLCSAATLVWEWETVRDVKENGGKSAEAIDGKTYRALRKDLVAALPWLLNEGTVGGRFDASEIYKFVVPAGRLLSLPELLKIWLASRCAVGKRSLRAIGLVQNYGYAVVDKPERGARILGLSDCGGSIDVPLSPDVSEFLWRAGDIVTRFEADKLRDGRDVHLCPGIVSTFLRESAIIRAYDRYVAATEAKAKRKEQRAAKAVAAAAAAAGKAVPSVEVV